MVIVLRWFCLKSSRTFELISEFLQVPFHRIDELESVGGSWRQRFNQDLKNEICLASLSEGAAPNNLTFVLSTMHCVIWIYSGRSCDNVTGKGERVCLYKVNWWCLGCFHFYSYANSSLTVIGCSLNKYWGW